MAKFKNKEEAEKALKKAKNALTEANNTLTEYLKSNKLKRNVDYTGDKKHGVKITKLQDAIVACNKVIEDTKKSVAEFKPEKGAGKPTKYEYPEGLTSDEKKKFRIEARKAAKGGTKKPTEKKVEKKSTEKKVEKTATNKKAKAKGKNKTKK